MEFEHRHERRLRDAIAFTVSHSLTHGHGSGDTDSFGHADTFGDTDTKLHAQLVGGWCLPERRGPWRWRLSNSDTHGESLWTMPDRTRVFRIAPEGSYWVLQFGANDPAREPFDRLFHDTIFPSESRRKIP